METLTQIQIQTPILTLLQLQPLHQHQLQHPSLPSSAQEAETVTERVSATKESVTASLGSPEQTAAKAHAQETVTATERDSATEGNATALQATPEPTAARLPVQTTVTGRAPAPTGHALATAATVVRTAASPPLQARAGGTTSPEDPLPIITPTTVDGAHGDGNRQCK